MKFKLAKVHQWEYTDEHILEKDNAFYDKEIIEERKSRDGGAYYVHFIEIESLEKLLQFINSTNCKSVVITKGSWQLGKKNYTIEVCDEYRD